MSFCRFCHAPALICLFVFVYASVDSYAAFVLSLMCSSFLLLLISLAGCAS